MITIQAFITEFRKIKSREGVRAFAERFGLQSAGIHPNGQVIGFFKGTIAETSITITHSWYDRCRTFSIQPDGNKVLLEIVGMNSVEIGFLDDF